jgi:hypothetical protein
MERVFLAFCLPYSFDPEDGGYTFLRIVGELLPNYRVATHNIVRYMVTGMRTSNPTKHKGFGKKENKKTFCIK